MNILSRVSLALALSTLCISAPTIAAAEESVASHKVRHIWLEPNGIDDTSNLQGVLDSCTDSSYPCKIKLASGVFHIAPVVATNFHGEVRGAGQDVTIVRALTDRVLHLSQANPYYLFDPTPQEPWGNLVQFVEGDVLIKDLTIHVPGETQTDGWWGICGAFRVPVLASGLEATGRDPMRFVVRNVSVLGAETGDEDWPVSITRGIGVIGFMLREDSDDCMDMIPARGEFIFDSNYTSTGFQGISVRSIEESDIRITGNTFEDALFLTVRMWDIGHSSVYVASNNVHSDFGTGIALFQNVNPGFDFPVYEASEYTVLDNTVHIGEFAAIGINYYDFLEGQPPAKLNVSGNTVHVGEYNFVGINISHSIDSKIERNRVSGAAFVAAIAVSSSSDCRIRLNDLSGFDGESPDILLNEDASNCRVHAFAGDTVEDNGTDNRIVYE